MVYDISKEHHKKIKKSDVVCFVKQVHSQAKKMDTIREMILPVNQFPSSKSNKWKYLMNFCI